MGTWQQKRILASLPKGVTITDPTATILGVGAHSEYFLSNVSITSLTSTSGGFSPFVPLGHKDGYHNAGVINAVHVNYGSGTNASLLQGHIDIFNPSTGLFGLLGHGIVDFGVGQLLNLFFPGNHILDPGC
jgi:hypothetical protein